MSMYRVHFGVVQRSAGGSAPRRSAYQRCIGEYAAKASEHQAGWLMLPDSAPFAFADPARLWAAAEEAERRGDAQVAGTMEITIPRIIPQTQHRAFVAAVLEPFRVQGMALQVDLHRERATDEGWNDHAHVEATVRPMDAAGFTRTKAAAREWNAAFTTENGRTMRQQIADRMNEWMAAAGIDDRVDARSYEARGLDGFAGPELPKGLWRQWERLKAKDPNATPPQPIAEYLAWKAERNSAAQEHRRATAYLAQIKEQHRHEPAATDHRPCDQKRHRGNPRPPVARRGAEPDPRSAGRHSGGGSGPPAGGHRTAGGLGRTARAAAELARLKASLAQQPQQIVALNEQVARLNPARRAAGLRREAAATERRARRVTDIERILSDLLPGDIPEDRQRWLFRQADAEQALARNRAARPRGIWAWISGQHRGWKAEARRLADQIMHAARQREALGEQERCLRHQLRPQAVQQAGANHQATEADRAQAVTFRADADRFDPPHSRSRPAAVLEAKPARCGPKM